MYPISNCFAQGNLCYGICDNQVNLAKVTFTEKVHLKHGTNLYCKFHPIFVDSLINVEQFYLFYHDFWWLFFF